MVASIAVVAMSFTGCMAQVDSTVVSVNPVSWRSADPKQLVFQNDDTLSLRTISVIMRHTPDIEPRTVILRITAMAPDSSQYSDRLEITLPATETNTYRPAESVTPYRLHNTLAMQGEYRFTVAPSHDISGIDAVGIRISREN